MLISFYILLSWFLLPSNDQVPRVSEYTLPLSSNRYTTGEQYLTLSEVDLSVNTLTATFDLSWDASWRDSENYDAAWIFAKARGIDGKWHPVQIIDGSPKQIAKTTGGKAAFEVPADRMGVYVFRAQQGEGDNHWRIQLQLENPRTTPIAELKLFGVEMVYIPEGAFELGTTKSVRQRREELTPGAGGAPYDSFFKFSDRKKGNYGGVYRVSSEETISIGKVDGNLFWQDISIRGTNTFSGVPKGKLEADFPKGYKGFYCMKYELSQQQYCDFLNTIDAMPQRARDITSEQEYNRPIRDYRNMIHNYEGDFVTSRPLRPCNFLSWLDGQAYADWAGLRHMTELEFEKACRGPKPAVYREYVWGVNEIAIKSNMVFSTKIMMSNGALAVAENGLIQTDGNVHASMFSYFNIDDVCKPGAPFYDPDCDGCRGFSGGDGGRGPVRMGIFGVNSNGDRIAAGATYYGLMEMGGNLQEPVVTVGHPSGRKFQGTHGNGVLSANGQATNADWQPIDGDYAFAGRGGCWKFHENHARTADRFKGLRTKPDRRASHIGFRGVRTRN